MLNDAEPPHANPRHVGLTGRGEEVNRVTAAAQLSQEAGGGGLDAAVKREWPANDAEPQRRRRTRSINGKRSRRAAVKL